MRGIFLGVALGLVLGTGHMAAGEANEYFLYSGTYTGFKYVLHGNPSGESHSQGIYVSRFRPATGDLTEAKLAAKIANPSFLAVSPNHRFLYAASEDPLSLGPARDHESYRQRLCD